VAGKQCWPIQLDQKDGSATSSGWGGVVRELGLAGQGWKLTLHIQKGSHKGGFLVAASGVSPEQLQARRAEREAAHALYSEERQAQLAREARARPKKPSEHPGWQVHWSEQQFRWFWHDPTTKVSVWSTQKEHPESIYRTKEVVEWRTQRGCAWTPWVKGIVTNPFPLKVTGDESGNGEGLTRAQVRKLGYVDHEFSAADIAVMIMSNGQALPTVERGGVFWFAAEPGKTFEIHVESISKKAVYCMEAGGVTVDMLPVDPGTYRLYPPGHAHFAVRTCRGFHEREGDETIIRAFRFRPAATYECSAQSLNDGISAGVGTIEVEVCPAKLTVETESSAAAYNERIEHHSAERKAKHARHQAGVTATAAIIPEQIAMKGQKLQVEKGDVIGKVSGNVYGNISAEWKPLKKAGRSRLLRATDITGKNLPNIKIKLAYRDRAWLGRNGLLPVVGDSNSMAEDLGDSESTASSGPTESDADGSSGGGSPQPPPRLTTGAVHVGTKIERGCSSSKTVWSCDLTCDDDPEVRSCARLSMRP
jgi:hypothetical protein